MRKLVVFETKEDLAAKAAGHIAVTNYRPKERTGEYDDGCGNFGRIEFITADELPGTDVSAYDSVEIFGFKKE